MDDLAAKEDLGLVVNDLEAEEDVYFLHSVQEAWQEVVLGVVDLDGLPGLDSLDQLNGWCLINRIPLPECSRAMKLGDFRGFRLRLPVLPTKLRAAELAQLVLAAEVRHRHRMGLPLGLAH